jgi:hypothetical protein
MRTLRALGIVATAVVAVLGAVPAVPAGAVGAPPQVLSIFGDEPVIVVTGALTVRHPLDGTDVATQDNSVSCNLHAELSGAWESEGPGTYTAKNKGTCSTDVDEMFYSATLYRNDEPVVSANDHCTWPCEYGVADFDQRGCDICGGSFYGYFSFYIVDYDVVWHDRANCTVGDNGHQLNCRYRSAIQYAPS